MKHVELDFHFVREKTHAKNIVIQYIPYVEKPTDMLTMALLVASFVPLQSKLSVMLILGMC